MTAYNVSALSELSQGRWSHLQAWVNIFLIFQKQETRTSSSPLSHIQDRPQDGLKLWTLTYSLASPRAGMTGLNQQAHLPLFCFESDIR